MERTLDPVLLAIREVVESDLDRLGFHLASEKLLYDAFGSATFEYHRRGTRLRLNWDGKDRWAWLNLAPQPTSAYPHPDTYRDIDAAFVAPNTMSPGLATTDQGLTRARELVSRLAVALGGKSDGARAV
jgi:hypothetical protein